MVLLTLVSDGLLVLLVFARAQASQTEAAGVGWVHDVRPAPYAWEAHLVLGATCALAGPMPGGGTRGALHALATRQRLNNVCRALDEWEVG
jgi:hypothetical protein